MRRMLHRGRALRTGYVECVAVHAGHRRAGVGGALMAPLERAIDAAYDLGALGASDMALPFYASRGWLVWRGALSALTPEGVVPTPDELGGILVRPAGAPGGLDLDGELTCDWRDGEVW
jgi:aminoglycoside 2'-N-acetyltransferase I